MPRWNVGVIGEGDLMQDGWLEDDFDRPFLVFRDEEFTVLAVYPAQNVLWAIPVSQDETADGDE